MQCTNGETGNGGLAASPEKIPESLPATKELLQMEGFYDESEEAGGTSARSMENHSAYNPKSVDMELLETLEVQATKLATSTIFFLKSLQKSLSDIAKVTGLCAEAYSVAVEQYSQCCDNAMRDMIQLLSKADELDKAMVPMYDLANQIKAIKRQLDVLESISRTKK